MPARSSHKRGRKPTGSVVEKTTRRGTAYALRFRAYGNREYETLGGEADGWTRELAEQELERRLAQVKLGQYIPPHQVEPESTDEPEPSFRELAWDWLEDRRLEVAPSTAEVYTWHVRLLCDYFGTLRPSEIGARELDCYKRHMQRRARSRDERALSAETINKTLVRLGAILQRAKRYGYVVENAARDDGVKLKTRKPQRSYLDSAEQIAALLDAARELDADAGRYRHVGRHAMIATLVFAGLRLGELLSLRWRDVDLAGGWLRVKAEGDGKTEAATRDVKIRPVLRDILLDRKAATGAGAGDLVFGTEHGREHSQSNVRNRIVTKAAERASGRLETPLPKITPHSLRRTFMSVLYAIGEPPTVVMAEVGHTDPKLSLRIYAQAMRRDPEEVDRLRALVNGERIAAPEVERVEV